MLDLSARPEAFDTGPEFLEAIETCIGVLRYHRDVAIAYAATNVPIYAQWRPTPDQARAGGCRHCTYYGLWAREWAGYTGSDHGIIWLFEHGIRTRKGDLLDNVMNTLLHEIDHALQRDHILKALGLEQEARAHSVRIAPCLKQHPC